MEHAVCSRLLAFSLEAGLRGPGHRLGTAPFPSKASRAPCCTGKEEETGPGAPMAGGSLRLWLFRVTRTLAGDLRSEAECPQGSFVQEGRPFPLRLWLALASLGLASIRPKRSHEAGRLGLSEEKIGVGVRVRGD